MAKLAAAIVLLLASVCVVSAASDGFTAGDSGLRKLLQARKVFPFSTKCFTNGKGSPYLLSGPEPSVVDGVLQINLTVVSNPAATLPSCPTCPNCFEGLNNNLNRIEIRSGVSCAIPDAVKGVYINGVKKTSGVTWGLVTGQPDAVLRLSNLQLKQNAVGTQISILLGDACNKPGMFTGPRGGKLMYFMSNTTAHECCPINTWDWGKSWAQGGSESSVGFLSVKVVLSKDYFTADDVSYDKQQIEAAIKTVTDVAGVTADVTGITITPDRVGTDFGYDVRVTFTGDLTAAMAGSVLDSSAGLSTFIKTAGVPCGSTIQLAVRSSTLGSYACTKAKGATALPGLCLASSGHACVAAGEGEESGAESSAEGSFSSSPDNNGQEGSAPAEEESSGPLDSESL